ncbi:hypothetical protein AAFC00_002970 [Neodothiora populina]
MLVSNDAQREFQRIERKETPSGKQALDATDPTNGSANGVQVDGVQNGEFRNRKTVPASMSDPGSTLGPRDRKGTLTWQSYPAGPFIERLDWICDLFGSFRGMGWSFRIAGLPPPPESVQHDLSMNTGQAPYEGDTHVGRSGNHRYHTRREILRYNGFLLVRNYLILDLLKTLIVNDPYFWTGSYTQRPRYLPAWLDAYPVIDQSSRLLISLAAVYYSLETIFSLGPLFFVGILGPRYIGVRGEPWIYSDQFGSFSAVLDKGLAGWWGGWWHQTFRFGFESPSTRLLALLGWHDRKSPAAKLLQLCVAFALSGCVHACGSYTQLGDTQPLKGPFLFFVLQVVGISAQLALTAFLNKLGIASRTPKWLSRMANFVYVHVWLYHTAPLLVDDFARGGVWLYEPLPFSPLRGLGFGADEDGWFPLSAGNAGGVRDIFRWHRGSTWWNSGVAL